MPSAPGSDRSPILRCGASQREGRDVVTEPSAAVPEQIQVQLVEQLAGCSVS
ncbi:hypothetical protein [Streptomyces viridochromogenes]|uniref:hypothetical protein n=1 Tax=Streptomyces viridochromogenes TaxID=1938 RepID=UPI0002DF8D05